MRRIGKACLVGAAAVAAVLLAAIIDEYGRWS